MHFNSVHMKTHGRTGGFVRPTPESHPTSGAVLSGIESDSVSCEGINHSRCPPRERRACRMALVCVWTNSLWESEPGRGTPTGFIAYDCMRCAWRIDH